jgi:hypothetical protein
VNRLAGVEIAGTVHKASEETVCWLISLILFNPVQKNLN